MWEDDICQPAVPNLKYVFFFFLFLIIIIMHQLVKIIDTKGLLQLVISSPLIHALGDLSQEPGSSDWEADDLPTQLSLPPPEIFLK